MGNKPALLLPDDLIEQLDSQSIYKAMFKDVTGYDYPWEVNYNKFDKIRGKFNQIERGVRSAYPNKEITCVITGKGAFWLPQSGTEMYKEKVDRQLQTLKSEGPMPIWRFTSAEMYTNHLGNIRQLIMAVAHDLVLLEHLRDSFTSNHDFIQREFERCELHVRGFLDELKEHGDELSFAVSDFISLAERCRITQEMLIRGEATPEELGYDEETLSRVLNVIDVRLKKRMPSYQRRIMAVHNKVKDSLRGGEVTQLTRVSRWDMAYALMGDPPAGYKGQAMLASMEHEGMNTFVSSREQELGVSEHGQEALNISQQVESVKSGEAPPAYEPEPAEETHEDDSAQSETEKKKKTGMAYLNRRR